MDDNTQDNNRNSDDRSDNKEQERREREAADEVEVNHPDSGLEDDRKEEDDELKDISGDPGDNLTDQHPTQDQTAGESGTSGLDDEVYDTDEDELKE